MGFDHEFVLLDRLVDGEWALTRFINHPRAIRLHDDLVQYMFDTLKWIPTHNPSKKVTCHGLNMCGCTLIEQDGAAAAERVFRAWARLFENAPETLELTGSYSWLDDQGYESGRYERLEYARDETVCILDKLADYSIEIQAADGRLYLYHGGV